jgi:hypothetical protein
LEERTIALFSPGSGAPDEVATAASFLPSLGLVPLDWFCSGGAETGAAVDVIMVDEPDAEPALESVAFVLF